MKLGILLLSIVFIWNCSPNDNSNDFAGENSTESTILSSGQTQSSSANAEGETTAETTNTEIDKDNQLFSSDELQGDQEVSKFNSGNINTEECAFTIFGLRLRLSDKQQFNLSGSLSTMGWGTNGSQQPVTTTQAGTHSNALVNKCISSDALTSGKFNESYIVCSLNAGSINGCKGFSKFMNRPSDTSLLSNSAANYANCLRNAAPRGSKCFKVSEIQ